MLKILLLNFYSNWQTVSAGRIGSELADNFSLVKKSRFGRKIASFVCFLISFSLFLVSEFVVVQLYVFRLYNLDFQK